MSWLDRNFSECPDCGSSTQAMVEDVGVGTPCQVGPQFCKKCGGLLVPQKKGSKMIAVCRSCGSSQSPKSPKDFKIKTHDIDHGKIIVVAKKFDIEALPKTHATCPKCEHNEAYWWMEQTRAADEAPTRFYKCVKCKHTWREYE